MADDVIRAPRARLKGMPEANRLDKLPKHLRDLIIADARRRLADAPDPTDELVTRMSRPIQRSEATPTEQGGLHVRCRVHR